MNVGSVKQAKEEAIRFIKSVERVEIAFKQDPHIFMGSKVTAACKRASLDLSRALSEMRHE